MKKFFNKMRKHKLLVLFAILMIIALICLIKLILIFTESDEVALYGNRLNGADKVEVKESTATKEVKSKIKDDIDSVKVRVQGRIVNIIINIKKETNRDKAKEISQAAIDTFSDGEKEYYDFQIFVSKKDDADDSGEFPIVGYKHHTKDGISWTKDRTGNDE